MFPFIAGVESSSHARRDSSARPVDQNVSKHTKSCLLFVPLGFKKQHILLNKEFFCAQTETGLDLKYAALRFSGRAATTGRKKKEEDCVYAKVKF